MNKIKLAKLSYQVLTLEAFEALENNLFVISFFEANLSWLQHTESLLGMKQEFVYVHLVKQDEKLIFAWPLIHQGNHITSLTSFYSSISEPYYCAKQLDFNIISYLFTQISRQYRWHKMQLGPLNEQGELTSILKALPCYHKVFSRTDNWCEDNINAFQTYYQQRPSRLKNTIKRREKQLTKQHNYHIKVITTESEFLKYFQYYQDIYRKSWKGEEFSYAFIEQVSLHACQENKLRMGMLFVDDVAVAAQIWFLQSGTASIFKLAYDPNYKQYSVGSILSLALSEHVIDIDKVHTIEFGMGNEPYKQEWMSKCRQRVTLQLFNQQTIIGNILAFRYIALAKIKRGLKRLWHKN